MQSPFALFHKLGVGGEPQRARIRTRKTAQNRPFQTPSHAKQNNYLYKPQFSPL